MASRDLNLSVVLRAVDHLSGPLRKAARSLEDVNRVAERSKGLRNMARDLDAISGSLARIGTASLGAGLGAAFGLGLTEVPGQAVAAEHALRAIGNTADLTTEQIAFAETELRSLSADVNQTQSALVGGLGQLTAAGLDFETSIKALGPIGKTATAEVAALGDVTDASFAVIDNLEVPVGRLGKALDIMAQAGQEGKFELKDMAGAFSELTSKAALLEMRGLDAVASISAALQIAMKGTGDRGQAANNLSNFLNKITAPETVKRFQDMGVDIKAEFQSWAEAGKDPILEMVKLIQELTGGDTFKLGQLFGDVQVKNFLAPMLENLEEFKRIKRVSLAAEGLVDEDFLAMMTTTREQWKLLRIQLAATFSGQIQGALDALNKLLTKINDNPALQNLILGGVAAMTTFGALALGLAGVHAVGSHAFKTVAGAIDGAAALRAGWVGAAEGLEGGQRVIGKLGGGLKRVTELTRVFGGKALSGAIRAFSALAGGLRLATVATWSFTASLLANPITWMVAGVVALAAAAFLIYKHWDAVSQFFVDLWNRVTRAFNAIPTGVLVAVAPLIGIPVAIYRNWDKVSAFFVTVWEGVKAAFGSALDWIQGLDFFEAGVNILKQLWEGMKSMAAKPIELVANVARAIGDFFIAHSPPRVGPLRDLDRVRILETVAETVRPAPLVNAMRAATAAAMAVVPLAVAAPAVAAVPAVVAPTRLAPLPALAEPPQRSTAVPLSAPLMAAPSAQPQPPATAPVFNFYYTAEFHVEAGASADVLEQLRSMSAVQEREFRDIIARAVREEAHHRDRIRFGSR
ncbi:MAG TPA: phage tail tape measure protein [Longimicrobiales bacterium]